MERVSQEKKPLDYGKKLVVTEYAVDSWYASQSGLDINNIPPYRPPNINKVAYETLKKYASYNLNEEIPGNNNSGPKKGKASTNTSSRERFMKNAPSRTAVHFSKKMTSVNNVLDVK